MPRNFADEARALSNQLEAIGALDFATALRDANLHRFTATPHTELHETTRALAADIDAAIRR